MADTAAAARPRPLRPLEMDAWRAFIHAAGRVLDRLDRELEAEHGLTLADYEVLAFLSEAPERRLRMSELADRVLVSRSRLTYRVDQLATRGYVERERCDADRRGLWAVLTTEGFDALRAAYLTHLRGVRRYLVDPVGEQRAAALASALNDALAAVDAADASPDGTG